MKTWLILDVNYLCRRAFYSARGKLSYGDVKTGVIFGVMSDVLELQETFRTNDVIFCFDCGRGIRKDIYEGYKAKRHGGHGPDMRTDEERKVEEEYQQQVYLLRTLYLKMMGFNNVFFAKGFESDDIMVQVARSLPRTDEVILVTADHDLYQAIDGLIQMYDPKTRATTSANAFRREYDGLPPMAWWKVLCLAGCKTDEVPGIHGIGKTSAVKYLMGTLKGKKLELIQSIVNSKAGKELLKRNRRLVKLPLEGTPEFTLREDTISEEGWRKVANLIGAKTLIEKMPRRQTKKKTLFN